VAGRVRSAIRALLAWFTLFGIVIGGWQLFAPASFYRDFPGLGRHWVDVDGPYNEHLMRDVGQGNVALGAVALVALVSGGVWVARATGVAAVVANLPHQLYHQEHIDTLPETVDQVLQTLALTVVTVTSVLLTVLAFRLPATRAPHPRARADVS